jgi:hypothetical protein
MSKLEKWWQSMKDQSLSPEESKRIIQSQAKDREPFRLEVLVDWDDKLLLIQGNLRGINYLKSILERFVNTKAPRKHHTHLVDGHGLTKANVEVIIQLVDDDEANDGPHSVNQIS